jgi:hypothetical protein
MLIASVIMLVGVISVVQLVPASLQLNASNRLDTLATVIAQRELDQMLSQPLAVNSFVDKGTGLASPPTISLGGANSPGAPVVLDSNSQTVQINFNSDPIAGYSIENYSVPNDPTGATFDLRWAVIPQNNPLGKIISRRIIIGCRQTNATRPVLPVNLDSWQHR